MKTLLLILFSPYILFADYAFQGKHYIAEFYGCCDAINDIEAIKDSMQRGCIGAGATIIDQIDYEFDNGGYTCLIMLAESHASIHTYPERSACFIDIFTCGDRTNLSWFYDQMQMLLRPKEIDDKLISRGKQQ